jgi:pyroglutamyl-peptidase
MAHGTILLTGFEPFGGESINPSWRIAAALDGSTIDGWTVAARQLPTTFAGALPALDAALDALRPGIVLGLGQAGGRGSIDFERVAINVNDARIPDNDGAQPIDEPVVPGAPVAYFSTLPIKAMQARIARAGIPASVSQTAGTFVCNHTFFGLMHRLAGQARARGGFAHVPWLPQQGTPSLALDQLVEGVRLALEAAVVVGGGRDVRLAAGALH